VEGPAITDHPESRGGSLRRRFPVGIGCLGKRSNLTTSWSYDATGFVQPGPLAVFKPSLDMTDYRFEFLGEIDQKGMGCAFRAKDLNNYYALKLIVVKPGPLPMVRMVRYAVINGKEGPHIEKPFPLTVRKDMLYRVMLECSGPRLHHHGARPSSGFLVR